MRRLATSLLLACPILIACGPLVHEPPGGPATPPTFTGPAVPTTPAQSIPPAAPGSPAPDPAPAPSGPAPAPAPVPSDGRTAPAATTQPPAGVIALCNDGTYSRTAHHEGACSHHQGVARFYD